MKKLGIRTLYSSLLLIFLSSQPSAQAETVMITAGESKEIPATQQPRFLSPLEERLHVIGKTLYEKRGGATGQFLKVGGKSLGKIPSTTFTKDKSGVKQDVVRLLEENAAIIGDITGYEFEITKAGTGTPSQKFRIPNPQSSIEFHQVINGLKTPPSIMYVSQDTGDVVSLSLVTADPGSPMFDRSTWLSEEKLHESLRSIVDSQLGGFEEGNIHNLSYQIIWSDSDTILAPAWVVYYGVHLIRIDPQTGALLYLTNQLRSFGETQCEDDGTLPGAQHRDCHESDMDIFRINGVCQGGHAACSEPRYSRAWNEISQTIHYPLAVNMPAPSDYDLMFKAVSPVWSLTTAWFLPYGTPLVPVIGLGTTWFGASSLARDDAAVHEYGHAWHWENNQIGYGAPGNLTNIYSEAVADTFLAIVTGDLQINDLNGGSRHLNSGTTYSDITYSPFHVTPDSVVLSELFIDIRTAIGFAHGNHLFAKHVKSQSPALHGSLSDYTIDDFRVGLRQIIYQDLNKSQRTAVCNLWASKQFPGTLCNPPSTPSGMVAFETGACVTAWSESQQQYVYGSEYYFTWLDVDREDHYDNCVGNSLAGPWSCLLVAQQNGTSSLPHTAMTSGTGYAGVRACNESGCSTMNITVFYNQCP